MRPKSIVLKTPKIFLSTFHTTVCLQSVCVYFMCGLWKQLQRCSDQKRNTKFLTFHENYEIFFQPFHSTVCILSFSVYFMCGLWKQIHSCSDHKKNKQIQEIKIHGIFVRVSTFPSESVLWKQIQRCSDQKRNNKILKFHENHEIFFSSTFSFNSVFTKLQHLFHVRPVETTIEVLRSQKEQKKSRD